MVSVILPIYNNAATLQELVLRIKENLSAIGPFEMVAVNDHSPDNSDVVLRTLQTQHQELKVITHDRNRGQHQAILSGMKGATGNIFVVMDADLQDNPEFISTLVATLEDQSVEACFAQREGLYQSYSRMITSRMFKRSMQVFTGLNYRAGTFFAIRKAVYVRMTRKTPTYPFVTIMVANFAQSISYIKAPRTNNKGISSYTFGKRISNARKAILCAFECRKIRTKSKAF